MPSFLRLALAFCLAACSTQGVPAAACDAGTTRCSATGRGLERCVGGSWTADVTCAATDTCLAVTGNAVCGRAGPDLIAHACERLANAGLVDDVVDCIERDLRLPQIAASSAIVGAADNEGQPGEGYHVSDFLVVGREGCIATATDLRACLDPVAASKPQCVGDVAYDSIGGGATAGFDCRLLGLRCVGTTDGSAMPEETPRCALAATCPVPPQGDLSLTTCGGEDFYSCRQSIEGITWTSVFRCSAAGLRCGYESGTPGPCGLASDASSSCSAAGIQCDGSRVLSCPAPGSGAAIGVFDCAWQAKTCHIDAANSARHCIWDPACTAAPACDGDLLRLCVGGKATTVNCASWGTTCIPATASGKGCAAHCGAPGLGCGAIGGG